MKTAYITLSGRVLAFTLLTFLFVVADSQESRQEAPPLKERLFYGGNFSLQFGTVTDIEVSPVIGLWVLPRVAIAAGPSYTFYKFDHIRTDLIGGRAYVQYVLIRDLDKFIPLGIHTSFFLHAEDEMLSLESGFWGKTPVTANRFMINTFLAGVGISQQIGVRSSLNFMVLWALNDSGYSIYSNPEIRIGFVF